MRLKPSVSDFWKKMTVRTPIAVPFLDMPMYDYRCERCSSLLKCASHLRRAP